VAVWHSTVEGLELILASLDKNFWRGRRVFLTGHTGFKGSWLSLWLQQLGAHVTGYSLKPPTFPSLFDVANVGAGMHCTEGDIRDLPCLRRSMRDSSPEIVIHMAAQPLVRQSYQDPLETYSTNVIGTVNLLESVRATQGVKAVVNVTSDKCYENREWVWGYRENDPLGGHDPYSSSKGCSELISAAYRSSFFSPQDHSKHGVTVVSARAGNVIGGGDWAQDRLIPDILAAFETEVAARLRNPGAIRPWQHVLDALHGYLLLAEKSAQEGAKWSGAWNFGPDDEDSKPVGWIATELANRWGGTADWVADTDSHPHEAHYLKLDVSKARFVLGWRPRLKIKSVLDLVIDWTRAFASGADMRKFSFAQVARYEDLEGI
jgi:CDP-glucose 4,6-dehydratase